MKGIRLVVPAAIAAALLLALSIPLLAQEPAPPAKDEPPTEAPQAEPTPAPEPAPAPEAAPAPEPAPAKADAEPAPAPEAAPTKAEAEPAKAPAAEPPKELSPSAKALVPLADGYKKAYDELQKWIADVDAKTTAEGAKLTNLQEQIQKNEGAITKAKLDGDDKQAKELEKQNKQLWSELNTAKKSQAASFGAYSKEAEQRVKQYAADIETRLKAVQAAGK